MYEDRGYSWDYNCEVMWYIVTSFQNMFSGYLTLLKAITSLHYGFKDSNLLPSYILHVWVYSMLLTTGAFLSGSFWRHSSVLHSCLRSCPDVLHRCVASSLHAFTGIPHTGPSSAVASLL